MVSGASGALALVKRFGPGTEDNGLAGPFDESLAGKSRRVPAPMNPGPRAALFGDLNVEPDGPANGSQPIRSETNTTSGAAGSRR